MNTAGFGGLDYEQQNGQTLTVDAQNHKGKDKANWSLCRWVRHLCSRGCHPDPDNLQAINLDLIKWFFPRLKKILRRYFAYQVKGLEHIPDGPLLIVGNHNAGLAFYEPFCFAPEWYEQRGDREALHVLVHDVIMSLPLLGRFLAALGCVRATNEHTDILLDSGHKVVVFPGGNVEAFRPFSKRNQILFDGHTGFIRQALRHRVPMVPVVLLGGHRTSIILTDGRFIARLLRLNTILRSPTCPIFIGLPWIIGFGPIPHFPIPSLTTIQVLEPIYPERLGYSQEDADNPQILGEIYALVVGKMQDAMDLMVLEQGRIRKERWKRRLQWLLKAGR